MSHIHLNAEDVRVMSDALLEHAARLREVNPHFAARDIERAERIVRVMSYFSVAEQASPAEEEQAGSPQTFSGDVNKLARELAERVGECDSSL